MTDKKIETNKNDAQVTLTRGELDGATARVHVIPSRGGIIRLGVGFRASGAGGPIERTLGEITRTQARVLLETLSAALDATEGD